MAFITPDDTCGCCVVDPCDNFSCTDGNFPPSTSFRTVDAITITLTNPVSTNLHMNFGATGTLFNPPPGQTKVYNHRWLHITNLSAILGNYVLPRVTEETCFGNEVIVDGIPFGGATVYASTAVDGNNCPSGTISSWPAVSYVGSITWKITAKWSSGFAGTLQILCQALGPNGVASFFSNGKEPGDNNTFTDIEYVTVQGPGLFYFIPRNDIICNGGTLSLSPISGPVGGSFPPCTGYPALPGLLASYTLSP